MLPALCLLAWWAGACAARTHAPIYHCVGAHGEPVFSGQPCGTPAPPPDATGSPGPGAGDHCATSPGALRQALGQAFVTQDVNRLAGLIIWRDLDQAAARRQLEALAAWLHQPLTGITPLPTGAPPPAATWSSPVTPPAASTTGTLPIGYAVATAGASATRDFGVRQQGGCWWLTF